MEFVNLWMNYIGEEGEKEEDSVLTIVIPGTWGGPE
tara:strand:- start:378 stop:485 length:108 start_codon:yes stop_codon:yes gene_type:complete